MLAGWLGYLDIDAVDVVTLLMSLLMMLLATGRRKDTETKKAHMLRLVHQATLILVHYHHANENIGREHLDTYAETGSSTCF